MTDAMLVENQEDTPQDAAASTTGASQNGEMKALMKEAAKEAFIEMSAGLATKDDIQQINSRLDQIEGRLNTAEGDLQAAPEKYVSKSDFARLEGNMNQLTENVGRLAAVQATDHQTFKDIGGKLDKIGQLESTVGLMKESLDTYMRTGRERLDNHGERLTATEKKIETLTDDTALTKQDIIDTQQRFITDYIPLRDFIKGSDTQEPLKAQIDGIKSSVSGQQQQLLSQGGQLKIIADYVEDQKRKAEEEAKAQREYWRNIRRNFSSPRGMMFAFAGLMVTIILIQAINLDQAFQRIREFFNMFGIAPGG